MTLGDWWKQDGFAFQEIVTIFEPMSALPNIIMAGPRDNPARTFLEEVLGRLRTRLARGPVSRSQGPRFQARMDELWNEWLKGNPGEWTLAPGLFVYGIALWLDHGYIFLRWRTEKSTERHRLPPTPFQAKQIPLGTFNDRGKVYELSCEYQGPRAPSLEAESTGEHLSWKLFQHSYMAEKSQPAATREAYRRAGLVNALAGTQWARPEPVGVLGAPTLLKPLNR